MESIRRSVLLNPWSCALAMASRYQMGGWPKRPNIYGNVAQVHAIGQITLAYNSFEATMDLIFQYCMTTEKEYSQRLFHKLNNRDRIDLLSAVVNSSPFHPEAKERLTHLLHGYDICTENRNILMHATFQEAYAGVLHLTKRSSNNPVVENRFRIPLTELRLVAEQIHRFNEYAQDMLFWVVVRKGFPAEYLGTMTLPPLNEIEYPYLRDIVEAIPGFATTLPSKPPKPRKLTPFRPPADRKGAQRPPRSSRGK